MSNQELEEVSFNIIVSSVWWNNPPRVRVWLDDELIETFTVTEKQENKEKKSINFKKSLPEGDHTISIELFGKTFAETMTDQTPENKILKDQLLIIEDIEIDEISLGYMTYSHSKFFPNRKIHPGVPEELKEMTCLGFNGKYKINFQTPTYIWFLENL